MKKYPYFKVFFGFSLCPVISTTLIFSFAFFSFENFYNRNESLLFYLALVSVVSLGALVFYGLPAVFLGMVSSLFKLHKGFSEVLFLVLLGGCNAYAWGPLIDFLIPTGRAEPFPGLIWHPSVPFLLGAISSFLISLWVLPKKLNQ